MKFIIFFILFFSTSNVFSYTFLCQHLLFIKKPFSLLNSLSKNHQGLAEIIPFLNKMTAKQRKYFEIVIRQAVSFHTERSGLTHYLHDLLAKTARIPNNNKREVNKVGGLNVTINKELLNNRSTLFPLNINSYWNKFKKTTKTHRILIIGPSESPLYELFIPLAIKYTSLEIINTVSLKDSTPEIILYDLQPINKHSIIQKILTILEDLEIKKDTRNDIKTILEEKIVTKTDDIFSTTIFEDPIFNKRPNIVSIMNVITRFKPYQQFHLLLQLREFMQKNSFLLIAEPSPLIPYLTEHLTLAEFVYRAIMSQLSDEMLTKIITNIYHYPFEINEESYLNIPNILETITNNSIKKWHKGKLPDSGPIAQTNLTYYLSFPINIIAILIKMNFLPPEFYYRSDFNINSTYILNGESLTLLPTHFSFFFQITGDPINNELSDKLNLDLLELRTLQD